MKDRLQEDEIRLRLDLEFIRHNADLAGWPPEAVEFVRRVVGHFPDIEDDTEQWPDWLALEILEWMVRDLAEALKRSVEPPASESN